MAYKYRINEKVVVVIGRRNYMAHVIDRFIGDTEAMYRVRFADGEEMDKEETAVFHHPQREYTKNLLDHIINDKKHALFNNIKTSLI